MNEFERTHILGRPLPLAGPERARLVPRNAAAGATPIELGVEGVALCRGEDDRLQPCAPGDARAELRLFRQGAAWGVEVAAGRHRIAVNRSPVNLCFLQSGDELVVGAARYRFVLRTDEPAAAEPAVPEAAPEPPPKQRIRRRGRALAWLVGAVVVASAVVLALI